MQTKAKNNQSNEPEVAEVKASSLLAEVEMPQSIKPRSDAVLSMVQSEIKVEKPQSSKLYSTAVSFKQAAKTEDPFVTELKQHVALRSEAIKDIQKQQCRLHHGVTTILKLSDKAPDAK